MAVAAERTNASFEAYQRWEYGLQEPRLDSLKMLCDAFGKSPDELGFGHLVKTPQQEPEEEKQFTEPTPSSAPQMMILTPEQAVAFEGLLGLGDDIMTDEQKRATLQTILATVVGIAIKGPFSLVNLEADPEAGERLERARTRPSALNTATLDRFERIIAECWELSNANELETADDILSSFLPKILALPQRRGKIAYLASHGLRLRSILVHHRLKIADKIRMCEQSVEYARSSDDSNTLVAALLELAVAYKYDNQPDNWFRTLQEASYHIPQASPLIQSQAYLKSALGFAHYGRKREAEFYVQMGLDASPDHPERDPGYALADSNIYTLSRDAGRAYLEMGHITEAYKAFEISRSTSLLIPERLRLEIVNGQSQVALLENDQEKYAYFLSNGLAGALALGSKKRFDEAHTTFKENMPAAWLGDREIQTIAEQYHLTR